MSELWLVRHGQTDWNVHGRLQGQADPPLNAIGWRQARAVADRLARTPFQAIYASDLRRAMQTARVIAARVGMRVRADERLREVHHGEWDGMLTSEVAARYPDRWADRVRNPVTALPPGGETVAMVAARTAAAADDIARAHPGARVLIVSHGLALATLVCLARGHSLAEAFDRIPGNAEEEIVTWLAR